MADGKYVFQATCDAEAIRSSVGRIDKFIKRDQSHVSLVAGKARSGRERRLWLEGHGDFGHMQLAITASGVRTEGDVRGVTVDQKVLQQMARGVGEVELSADGSSVRFRRHGTLGTLNGRIDNLPFEGRLLGAPRDGDDDSAKVVLDSDQSAALGKHLDNVFLHNAVAKDKEMEIWLYMTDRGSRMLIFDNWHAASVSMSGVLSDVQVAAHVDRDLFAAVASMPGGGWTMNIGRDAVRVRNAEFAVRSSVVEEYSGRTGRDMLRVMSDARKSAGDGTPRMTVPAKTLKELVGEMNLAGARSEVIELSLRKRGVLNWSCRTGNGRISIDQQAKSYNVRGKWPDEPVKLSPGLLSDIVDAMPGDGQADLAITGDSCLVRLELDGAVLTYMMLLS